MSSIFNFKKVLSIVLSILIVAQTASSWVLALNVRAGNFQPQVLVATTVESAMSWFWWDVSQSFLDNLWSLVWEDMSLVWLAWFNSLMIDGWITESALRWISRSLISSRVWRDTSRLDLKTKALVNMSSIVNKWHMTIDALRSIKDMFDDEKISPLWLTRLASLYREYNIYYVGMIEDEELDWEETQDNMSWNFSDDWIQRKYASTRFPWCEENDIIIKWKVFAACNVFSAWDWDNKGTHIDTYNNNWIHTTDENWWKYWALYPLEYISCPSWYSIASSEDIQHMDLEDFRYLKMTLWWYMLHWRYYNSESWTWVSNGTKFEKQWVVGKYITKDTSPTSSVRGTRIFINKGDWISFRETIVPWSTTKRWSLRCERDVLPTNEELFTENNNQEEYTKSYEKRCEEDWKTIARYDSNWDKTSTNKECRRWCNDEPACINQEEAEENQDEELDGEETQNNASWDFSADWVQRNYASTRFPVCKENDVIINDKVWAICNSAYDERTKRSINSNYNYWNRANIRDGSKDINWWAYGGLYENMDSNKCPSWYRVPTGLEFQWLDYHSRKKIKLPNIWFYLKLWPDTRGWKPTKQDFMWFYLTTDIIETPDSYDEGVLNKIYFFTPNGLAEELELDEPNYYDNLDGYDYAASLRCIRLDPPTQGELDNLEQDLDWSNNKSSDDEYVQSKVWEINQCHVDLYNSQLEELESTIDDFQNSVRDAHNRDNDSKALKYIKAIEKLEQIRQIITNKYRSVFGIE